MRFRIGCNRCVSFLPIRLVVVLWGAISLGGCFHTPAVLSHSQDLSDPLVIDLSKSLSLSEVLAHLHDTRVIFVGEQHDRFDHHLVQLAAVRAAHAANPDMAVGVEWIQRPFQQHLDDYVAGTISEAQMLARTEYFDRWRMDYRLYRPIFLYAREKGIPLIALNASRELTRAVSDKGIEGLPADMKKLLPRQIDRSNTDYHQRLRDLFAQHPATSSSFERFLDVQLIWDETMAETAASYLQKNPQRSMVILAGNGHLAYGAGIPDRLQRRIQLSSVIVLNAAGQPVDKNAADYLVFTSEKQLPAQGLIGAFLEDSDQGLLIKGFSADSAVKDAGLAEQDVVVALDGKPVSSFTDLKLILIEKTVGEKVSISYRSADDTASESVQTVEVELRGRKASVHP